MPIERSRRLSHSACWVLANLLVLSGIGTAHADPNPYYIGASAAVTHDSNVQRQPRALSDTYYSVGLLGGINQPIGRQRFYASGVVQNNQFESLKQLDNTSYGVNAGLDWATVYNLSGTVSFSGKENLFNSAETNTIRTTRRNIEKSDQSLARIRYGMASLLSLEGSFTHRRLSYSDPATDRQRGLSQDIVSAGLSYRPRAGLTLGTALRHTQGDYISGFQFKRNDLDLTATWVPSGLSTVYARLSAGRQTGQSEEFRTNFSGLTGYANWVYRPTGKLQLNTSISRDTGAENGFLNFNGQQVGGVGDTSRTTETASLDAIYDATAKIRVNANLRLSHRSLAERGLDGSDTLHRASIGLTYMPLRNVSATCTVGRDQRSASGAPISYSYQANTASCYAQITLQ